MKSGDDENNKRAAEWSKVEDMKHNEETKTKPVFAKPEFYFSFLTLANSMDRCGDRVGWTKRFRNSESRIWGLSQKGILKDFF